VEAISVGPATGQSAKRVVAKKPAVPLRKGWRIGSPISFERLTIFPVFSNESNSSQGFITLDEGLRSGKVIITEVGATGHSRRLGPLEQASDDADVNKLMLTNRSGKMLVLIAGELVVGGNQDRIVGHDCIVASSKTPVPLDVFCVEPGRWEERSAFGRSEHIERNTRGVVGGVSGGVPGGVAGGVPTSPALVPPVSLQNFSLAAGVMAAPGVREKAQAAKDQTAVWTEVASIEKENRVESATGTLNAVFENKEVSANIDAYERALKNKLSEKRAVGIVVAVGGTVLSADVFADSRMFQAYWPKLLRSYALEAMSAGENKAERTDSTAAEAFLARVAGTKSSDGRKRVYRLVEHESESEASFELVSTLNKQPALIHFNRVNKD